MDISTIKAAIVAAITDNGNQEITAAVLRPLLIKLAEGLQENITNEAGLRQTADSGLTGGLGQITTRLEAAITRIANEEHTRSEADAALQDAIDAITAQISGSATNLSQETKERKEADAALQKSIDNHERRVTSLETQMTSVSNVANAASSTANDAKKTADANKSAISEMEKEIVTLQIEGYKFGGMLPTAEPRLAQSTFFLVSDKSGAYSFVPGLESFGDNQSVIIVMYDSNTQEWSYERTTIANNERVDNLAETLETYYGNLERDIEQNTQDISSLEADVKAKETIMVRS